MKSGRLFLVLATLIAVITVVGCTESADTPKHSLADFVWFFKREGDITMQDVLARFGEAKLGPLLISDEGKAVKPEHAWWYYELKEGTRVGVQMDAGKVKGVYHFEPKPDGPGFIPRVIRKAS